MINKRKMSKPVLIILVIVGVLVFCCLTVVVIDSLFSNSTKTSTTPLQNQTIPLSTPESTATQTPASTSTEAAASTITANYTATATATITPTTGPTSIPSPVLIRPAGLIWSGVKVYYGNPPKVTFTILGGNDSCSIAPSGRGLYVEYPDGSREWKDRDYILFSGYFTVDKNDPAISALDWYEYSCN